MELATSKAERTRQLIQPNPALPGYNPNEEHALMLGGRGYALRDDLNLTDGDTLSPEAEAQLQAAQARHDLALVRAQAEIRRAWDVHRSLRERMGTLGETLLPESAGLLETARVAYAEGEMSVVELLDAADAYRSARESVNLLLGDYLISIYDLRRATGALLEPTTTTDASSR